MSNYIIHREEDELQHHGVLGMKWGVRRYQNPDGSYKSGAEGRYDPDARNDGYKKHRSPLDSNKENNEKWKRETKEGLKKDLKNLAKSALGIYKDGDGNPFVSEKRREDRRRQQEEQKKQQAEENNKKAQKDIEKGQWYKTYNSATDKFNPLLSELNKRFGDEADYR